MMTSRNSRECFEKVWPLFSTNGNWQTSGNKLPDETLGINHANNKVTIKQIKGILSGEEISEEVFRHVNIQLMYENCFNNQMHCNVLQFFHCLSYYGIRLSSYTDDMEKWNAAKVLLDLLLASSESTPKYEVQDDIRIKSDAILKLREWGYEIPIVQGCIQQTERDILRFKECMRYNIDQLGGAAVVILLDCMANAYSPELKRYMFHQPPPRWSESPKLKMPWGYLFNIALSFWTQTRKLKEKKARDVFKRLCDVATCFMATMELQPLSIFEEMLRSHKYSMYELQEVIMYEQHFGLDQIRPDFMLVILKSLVSQRPKDRIAQIYIEVLKWVCEQKVPLQPVRFTIESIWRGLHTTSYSKEEVETAIKTLSQDVKTLNTGCEDPYDATKRNYFKRPFVCNGEDYYLISGLLFAKGFYFAWQCLPRPKKEDIGKMFEHCVLEMLRAHNVAVKSNLQYFISKEKRDDLQCARDVAECDFIIETDKTIFFIEMKSKEITAAAMSGDPIAALTDMAKSALYGMTQAAIHEYCLRKDGRLVFNDGSVLELRGRRVEKIHLSSFDHYGLHDNMLVLRYLRATLTLDYSCESSPDAFLSIAEYQRDFRNIINTNVMKVAYHNANERLMSFRSFSLPQLMTILSDVNSTEDFAREIDVISHSTTGPKDWYFDYSFFKQIIK